MGCSGCNSENISSNKNEKKETKNELKNDIKKEAKKEISKSIEKNEIIKECHVKGSGPIIPEEISDVLKKSISRIEFDEKKKSFTGFFMKIRTKGENFNFILTCNHSITQEEINSKQQITIYFGKSGNEKKTIIILDDKKRLIKTYEDLDVTLIQILKEDKIKEKRFLYPDLNYKNIGFSIYKDSQVYTAGYPNVEFYKEGRHMSSGIITKINEYNFEHNCDIREGSSGSPILNLFKLVIGIQHGGDDKKNETNFGTFIGVIIDKLNSNGEKIIIKKEEEPKKINELNNFCKNTMKDKNFPKIALDSMNSLINSPEYMHYARKMASNPKITKLLNQTLIKNIPGMGNFVNNMKDLFDEDNLGEFNDFKRTLEHSNNKLNEEDRKDKAANEFKELDES